MTDHLMFIQCLECNFLTVINNICEPVCIMLIFLEQFPHLTQVLKVTSERKQVVNLLPNAFWITDLSIYFSLVVEQQSGGDRMSKLFSYKKKLCAIKNVLIHCWQSLKYVFQHFNCCIFITGNIIYLLTVIFIAEEEILQ